MSLLDDLREDLISDALKAPAAKRVRNEWHEPVHWHFNGYLARVREFVCPRCGSKSHMQTLGVFAEEVGSNHTRRLTKAHQFPLTSDSPRRVETETLDGELCLNCLFDLGFTDVVEAPSIPTNIAGEGMLTTPGKRNNLGFVRPESKERTQ